MSLALPFALLTLGGGLVWAAARKPKPPQFATPPALPPGPAMPFPSMPASSASPGDQAQQLLTQYALDAGMPTELATQVARVLQTEGDPTQLDGWAAKLDQLSFPKAAQALRAKASALRAVQGAGTALGRINDVLNAARPSGTAPDASQVRDQARDVVNQAAQVATQQPAATDAAAAAARAAAAAARAATTGSAADIQAAAQAAAAAAASVVSPIAQAKATEAVTAAQTAIATGSPTAAVQAAALAAQAASQVLQDATQAAAVPHFTIDPVQPASSTAAATPGAASPGEAQIRTLAQLAAADIRAKGCWNENRDLVKQFQKAVYPAAGAVDGFYGPQVALAMAKYLPKVPAPCYWPKAPADQKRAKAEWARMIREANVNVGRLWMGG